MTQMATNVSIIPLVLEKERDEKIFDLFGNNL
jgi:hypothetical protein